METVQFNHNFKKPVQSSFKLKWRIKSHCVLTRALTLLNISIRNKIAIKVSLLVESESS